MRRRAAAKDTSPFSNRAISARIGEKWMAFDGGMATAFPEVVTGARGSIFLEFLPF
jgi:hypothetical protein